MVLDKVVARAVWAGLLKLEADCTRACGHALVGTPLGLCKFPSACEWRLSTMLGKACLIKGNYNVLLRPSGNLAGATSPAKFNYQGKRLLGPSCTVLATD